MKTTLFLLIPLLLVGLGGCGDDDPTSVPADPIIFVIDVEKRTPYNAEPELAVVLAMENPGQVPSFEANGEFIMSYSVYGSSVSGYMAIPMADSIDFTLRSKKRQVSGTIQVPQRPDFAACNGEELVEYEGATVDPSGRYEFVWSGGRAEFYSCWLELYVPSQSSIVHWDWIEGERWIVTEQEGTPWGFSLTARTGSRGAPGEDPLIVSSWAEGYIFARDIGNWYPFDLPVSQQVELTDESAMDRLEKILNERTRGTRDEVSGLPTLRRNGSAQ